MAVADHLDLADRSGDRRRQLGLHGRQRLQRVRDRSAGRRVVRVGRHVPDQALLRRSGHRRHVCDELPASVRRNLRWRQQRPDDPGVSCFGIGLQYFDREEHSRSVESCSRRRRSRVAATCATKHSRSRSTRTTWSRAFGLRDPRFAAGVERVDQLHAGWLDLQLRRRARSSASVDRRQRVHWLCRSPASWSPTTSTPRGAWRPRELLRSVSSPFLAQYFICRALNKPDSCCLQCKPRRARYGPSFFYASACKKIAKTDGSETDGATRQPKGLTCA